MNRLSHDRSPEMGNAQLADRFFAQLPYMVQLTNSLGSVPVQKLIDYITGADAIADAPSSSVESCVKQVSELGLDIQPLLMSLIVNSRPEDVAASIAIFRQYKGVKNPEGLFYTILRNRTNPQSCSND